MNKNRVFFYHFFFIFFIFLKRYFWAKNSLGDTLNREKRAKNGKKKVVSCANLSRAT
jgi:hypothetical protein